MEILMDIDCPTKATSHGRPTRSARIRHLGSIVISGLYGDTPSSTRRWASLLRSIGPFWRFGALRALSIDAQLRRFGKPGKSSRRETGA
jgi:hypothetical protein